MSLKLEVTQAVLAVIDQRIFWQLQILKKKVVPFILYVGPRTHIGQKAEHN